MKSRIGRQLGSCALALTMISQPVISPPLTTTVFAEEPTSASLSIAENGSGSIDGGYTADVTIPTSEGTPFKVYSVYFDGGSFTVPNATAGTFSNGAYGNSQADISSNLTSVEYTVNEDASIEDITADLSGIVYKGAGTITVSAAEYAPCDGDVYYNGHYYRLSSASDTWNSSMYNMLEGDTDSYEGYKGHPITVTSTDENNMLINMLKSSNGRIWLGAVPSGSTGLEENGLPNVGYCLNMQKGNGEGWSWIWGTPEAGNTVVSGTQYWSNVQPDGGQAADSYVVYIGFNGTTEWDDLSASHALGGLAYANYVTEYSPWDGDSWIYDEEGNSATNTIGTFDKVQSVSMTYDYDNVGVETVAADSASYTGVYDGKEHSITVTPSTEGTTVTYSLEENGTYTTDLPKMKDVGEYTVYYRVEKAGYNPKVGSEKVTITAKPVEVNWTNINMTYDGSAKLPVASVDGLVDGETVNVNVSLEDAKGQAVGVGTYTAYASLDSANYVISKGDKQEFSIVEGDENGYVIYSAGYTGIYDGKEHSITVTSSTEGAAVTYSLKKNGSYTSKIPKMKDVGNYTVYYKVKKSGYKPKYGSEKVTITAKPVEVNWTNINMTYDGSAKLPVASIDGLVDGETVNVNVSLEDAKGQAVGVGTYTAYASIDSANYVISKGDKQEFSIVEGDENSYINYRTHVQTYGWESEWKKGGETSGTTGQSKRLEGIKIKLDNAPYEGSVVYRTHVQTYSWESEWKKDGETSGTTGEAKRLEAIEIKLTGKMAEKYDIYYRVHSQTYGWLDWAKNGEPAGTAGYAKRLEGIEIKLVKKGGDAPGSTTTPYVTKSLVSYQSHVQTYGWQDLAYDGTTSGTFGQAKRLEGIKINLADTSVSGDICYRSHVQTYGWENDWAKNGELSGTTGKAKRLEAIQIKLTEEMAEKYDIYYRAHVQTYGWLGWAKNGESAGTAGYAKRLEGVQIVLVPKGDAAPGSTETAFKSK